jgi:chromatin remodeling complex protein RSC6
MPETKVLSKKTIRRKLKKQRKRVRGLELVIPNEQLASIVGPEPRPRKELARHLHAYADERGLVDPVKGVVHADPTLINLFWGQSKLRQSDLLKVVTYALLPGWPTTHRPLPTKPKPEPEVQEVSSLVR